MVHDTLVSLHEGYIQSMELVLFIWYTNILVPFSTTRCMPAGLLGLEGRR